jgi:hypothetical protein
MADASKAPARFLATASTVVFLEFVVAAARAREAVVQNWGATADRR